MLSQLKRDVKKLTNRQKAKILARFFKTGKGEYGEGDVFLGITVPLQRKIAKKYENLPLTVIQRLLESRIHEHRLIALFILVKKYQQANMAEQERIVHFYLQHTRRVNNWDLVDLSAPHILGSFLLDYDRTILEKLARSGNLWERRIAILATFAFIKKDQFSDTLKIAKMLLSDTQDLVHKAVGWMLREVGKRNQNVLESFLQKHLPSVPRTTLRYAVERLSQRKRKKFLS